MPGYFLEGSKGNKYYFDQNDLLGSGSFGDVYKGRDESTGDPIAVKRVPRSILDRYGEEYVKCLGDEANLLLRMSLSDRTVRILDCFGTTNHIVIIMEFCDGGSLDKVKNKSPNGRIDEKKTLEYFGELAEGIL